MVCTTLDTSVFAGDCVANGRLPLGSSRGNHDHGQAVLALVKDKPSAALNKRRP